MRILVVDDDEASARAARVVIGDAHELRTETTLAGALATLRGREWRPDLVVAALNLPDSKGAATAEAFELSDVPVLISTGLQLETLSLMVANACDHRELGLPLVPSTRMSAREHDLARARLMNTHSDLAGIQEFARQAAEAAVDVAVQKLAKRLGLDDEEGVRMAVRLARGWEAAKGRFVATITTGLASAVLLALGAGLVALLGHRTAR